MRQILVQIFVTLIVSLVEVNTVRIQFPKEFFSEKFEVSLGVADNVQSAQLCGTTKNQTLGENGWLTVACDTKISSQERY